MKKINPYLLVVLLSFIGFACEDDKLESITIKSSGKLSVTLMNGNQPLAKQKVWFENLKTESSDVFLTDENGIIDFGLLNEGPYELYAMVKEPYTELRQEVHVISGETIQKEIQIEDYVGSLKYSVRDYYTRELVTGDLGLKILFVPRNDAFYEAVEYGSIKDHMFELATKEVNVSNQYITVDLPVASYNVYLVKDDFIIATHNYMYVERYRDTTSSFLINSEDYLD